MFNNELMADVHFIVGPPGGSQRVPAHKVTASPNPFRQPKVVKTRSRCVPGRSDTFPPSPQYVLAVGSSVFCAMFYSDLAEEESEIHIPDVEAAAFLILLK